MIIKELSIDDVNQFFKNDEKLCYLGLSDESLDYLYHTGTILTSKNTKFYGTYENDQLISFTQSDWWSPVCASIHMYLLTTLHHTGMIRKIAESMRQYVKETTKYKKVIIQVPGPCKHVHVACEKMGMTLEGVITNSIIWRQQTVDLYFYGMDL